MRYRRTKIEGGTYFFTVVTYNRRPFLCNPNNVELLRQAFRDTIQRHPMEIDAIVLLPDHLHCIWTLPGDDHNFSMRWRVIKSYFSRHCQDKDDGIISVSRQGKGERSFWQRRFWERTIRDDRDFANHVEYIHYNPVKHGLVTAPKDWEYSSFHRYVRAGLYDEMWGAGDEVLFSPEIGSE
ncbi:MAG: transposase [Candidatus Poribacteria bacterium]|nr:transposase [Candidatus Poribacteria bacterium]